MKILHMTFHSGTSWDVEFVCLRLGHSIKSINGYPFKYEITKEEADIAWKEKGDEWSKYDIIIVTDTCVLSRSILQQDPEKRPWIVVVATNRYDFHMSDDLEFKELFKNAKRCTFLANNEFDKWYAEMNGIYVQKMIRAVGPVFGDLKTIENTENKIAIAPANANVSGVMPFLRDRNIKFELLENGNITPPGKETMPGKRIRNFKALCHFPYQYSIMSMIENIMHDVVYLIPSKAFFLKLTKKVGYGFGPTCGYKIEDTIHMAEWYQPYFADYIIFFDSFDHLVNIIHDNDLLDSYRHKIPNFREIHHSSIVKEWDSVLSQIKL